MAADQLYKLFLAFIVGVSVAMLYDVLRARRRTFKGLKVLVAVEDILYWLAVTVAIVFTILYANGGELRGFIIAGILCGVLFYVILLSKHILNILVKVMWLIKTIVIWVYKIISWPLITIGKIIYAPLKFIYKLLSKCGKKVFGSSKKLCDKMKKIKGLKERKKKQKKVKKKSKGKAPDKASEQNNTKEEA